MIKKLLSLRKKLVHTAILLFRGEVKAPAERMVLPVKKKT